MKLIAQGYHPKTINGIEYALALLKGEDNCFYMAVSTSSPGFRYQSTEAKLDAKTQLGAAQEAHDKFQRFLYIMGDRSQT